MRLILVGCALFWLLSPLGHKSARQGAQDHLPMKQEWANGYSFVNKGATEEGVGLYSYVLLSRPSVATDESRAMAILDAVIGWADLDAPVFMWTQRIQHLGLIFVPVRTMPAVDYAVRDVSAREVLAAYDFDRVATMLASITAGGADRGPHVVSALRPLLESREVPRPYLQLDLSGAPTPALDPIVRAFKRQTLKQQTQWDAAGMSSWVSKFQKVLHDLAERDPNVKSALGSFQLEWRAAR